MQHTAPNPHFQYIDKVWNKYPASPGKKSRTKAGTISTLVLTKPKTKQEKAAALALAASGEEPKIPPFVQVRRHTSKATTFRHKVKQQLTSKRERAKAVVLQQEVNVLREDVLAFEKTLMQQKQELAKVIQYM
jgi:hypothetical protein